MMEEIRRPPIFIPNEILLLIFAHFAPGKEADLASPYYDGARATYMARHKGGERDAADMATLCSLCLVSKRFRQVAQPFLYREFVMIMEDNKPSLNESTIHARLLLEQQQQRHRQRIDPVARLIHFVRTVTENRVLARYVKKVSLRAKFSVSSADLAMVMSALQLATTLIFPSSPWTWDRCQEVGRARHLNKWPHPFKLEQAPGTNRDPYMFLRSELVACLVALLPNLESFDFRDDFYHSSADAATSIMEMPFFWEAAGVRDLPTLRTLRVDRSLGIRVPAMMLASRLEELHVEVQSHIMPLLNKEPSITFPCLKTLYITGRMRDGSEVSDLLDRCTGGLRNFIFRVRTMFPASEFVLALLGHHRKTLQFLHLDVCFIPSALGLPDLVRLENVSVFYSGPHFLNQLFFVLDPPVEEFPLPPSLECLFLSNFNMNYGGDSLLACFERFLELREMAPSRYPKLRRIVCGKGAGRAEEWEGMKGRLREVEVELVEDDRVVGHVLVIG